MAEGFPFTFQDHQLIARASRALWWPKAQALILADMHLGRANRYARRGGALLPPWEVSDTLARLAGEITALNPAKIFLLGDSFDDDDSAAELAPQMQTALARMAQGRDWHWISGNHDPGKADCQSVALHGLTLRHEIGQSPDISGHLHPVMRLGGKRWRCFAYDQRHLILPAFGSYTGGLDVESADFAAAMPRGRAVVLAGSLFEAPFPKPRRLP